jgi:DNA-binding NtrC family response regulator
MDSRLTTARAGAIHLLFPLALLYILPSMTSLLPPAATGISDTAVVYAEGGTPFVEEQHVQLHVAEGLDQGTTALLPASGLTIGTSSKAGFRLKDPAASRLHVELIPVPEGIRVRDLQSTNGTVVAGHRITEAVVPVGATLVLGKTRVELVRVVERMPLQISRRRRFGELIGSTPTIRQVFALLELAAETSVTVLIEGETGTGKELAARAVHAHSPRSREAFQIVDCGAVSPTLIEAELFGHVRGSFTGADRDRAGAFELAHQGTLFFDEIGELPLALQPKLLRALESREVRRIGGSTVIPVDVRFVAATNRNLTEEVKRGRFREDLFYRLNVFRVTLPPLREHREDIPILVKSFLDAAGVPSLSAELMERMQQHDWPGNVRELRNAVERAVILGRGERSGPAAAEPAAGPVGAAGDTPPLRIDASRSFKDAKAEIVAVFERAYIEQALARTAGNISAAARDSGIDRKHLERLIRKHGIQPRHG